MKAIFLLVPLSAALLGGCAYYSTPPASVAVAPAPVAVTPAYVAPTYVAPAYVVH